MARATARCYLCGLLATAGTLRRVGHLLACRDEQACDQRRAERVAARGTGAEVERHH